MGKLLIIAAGGAMGAVARYGLGGLVHQYYSGRFPLGTLVVNLLGSFAIGVLMSLVEDRQAISPEARLFWGVGILGAFTTFSTFGYETVQLVRDGSFGLATANIVVSVVIGLIAVLAGRAVVQSVSG